MEYFFPEIGRKADLFWEKKKIVFEVQCSPITLDEIKERTEDYRRIGLYPVWLLHEKLYGRSQQSAAERFIREQDKAYYIGQIDRKPLFYDIATGGRKLPILISRPFFRGKKLLFEGDALYLSLTREKKRVHLPFYTRWWKNLWEQSQIKVEKWIDRELEKDRFI